MEGAWLIWKAPINEGTIQASCKGALTAAVILMVAASSTPWKYSSTLPSSWCLRPMQEPRQWP